MPCRGVSGQLAAFPKGQPELLRPIEDCLYHQQTQQNNSLKITIPLLPNSEKSLGTMTDIHPIKGTNSIILLHSQPSSITTIIFWPSIIYTFTHSSASAPLPNIPILPSSVNLTTSLTSPPLTSLSLHFYKMDHFGGQEEIIIGDYAITTAICTNDYDCYLVDPENGEVITKDQREEELRQVIKFVVDEHTSHISIHICIKTNDQHADSQFAPVDLNCHAVGRTHWGKTDAGNRALPNLDLKEGDFLAELTLKDVAFGKISSAKIFTKDDASPFSPVRKVFVTDTITIIIIANERVYADYCNLVQAFKTERKRKHFSKWFPHSPQRYFLQKGAIPAREQRPYYELPRRPAFFSWEDYHCTLGYALVQEEEARQEKAGCRDPTRRTHLYLDAIYQPRCR